MCGSVRLSTLSNIDISETSRSIATKFHLKYYLGGGKGALGFRADRISTLVFIGYNREIPVANLAP